MHIASATDVSVAVSDLDFMEVLLPIDAARGIAASAVRQI
jgi:hypothetical protein